MYNIIKKIIKRPFVHIFNILLRNSKYENDISEIKQSIVELKKTLLEEVRTNSDSVSILVKSQRIKKIKIGFLVHNIEAWRGLEPVYRAMANDDNFHPIVFSLNRRYAGNIFRDEDKISFILDQRGIPHVRLNDSDSFRDLALLKFHNLNALFRQSHWIPDLPPAFQPHYLSFTNLYYLSYEIGVMPKQGLIFRYSDYERFCSKVFLASKEIKEEMDGLHNSTNVRAVVTGHPKVLEILTAAPSWPLRTKNQKRIIWSSHHSIGKGWSDFGVFDKVFEDFLQLAKKRKDWDILFSPHPALVHRLENLQDENLKQRFEIFLKEWNLLENTAIIDMGEYLGPFQASDLLVVDGLSFLIEYQLLGKPIIQLTREDSSDYTNFGERVTQGVHKLPYQRISDLEKMIVYLLNNLDPLAEVQQKLKEELTRNLDPVQAILDEIKKDLL